MTIQWGDTGKVAYGALKTITISPYVSEQTISSSITTTTIPASPQVSYTLSSSNSPTISPVPVSYKICPTMNVSGQNSSGAAQTINYQINKNGTSWKTGNLSVPNGNYFTVSAEDNAPTGTVYDFYLWATSSTGISIIYQSIITLASHLDVGMKTGLVNPIFSLNQIVGSNGGTTNLLTLTGHAAGIWNGTVVWYPHTDTTAGMGLYGYQMSPLNKITFQYAQFMTANKLFVVSGGGSSQQATISTHATNYPQSYAPYYVTSITYRELRI